MQTVFHIYETIYGMEWLNHRLIKIERSAPLICDFDAMHDIAVFVFFFAPCRTFKWKQSINNKTKKPIIAQLNDTIHFIWLSVCSPGGFCFVLLRAHLMTRLHEHLWWINDAAIWTKNKTLTEKNCESTVQSVTICSKMISHPTFVPPCQYIHYSILDVSLFCRFAFNGNTLAIHFGVHLRGYRWLRQTLSQAVSHISPE